MSDKYAGERLKALGELIAVDVLLNNPDRFPAVWNNNGNPRNALFKKCMLINSSGGGKKKFAPRFFALVLACFRFSRFEKQKFVRTFSKSTM